MQDGKVRPLERPKRKNCGICAQTNTRVRVEEFTTNNQLKRLLHSFNYPFEKGEGNA